MGLKSDLSDIEKTAIVRFLGEGYTSLIISKQLKRDHRTVKKIYQKHFLYAEIRIPQARKSSLMPLKNFHADKQGVIY